MEVHEGVVIEEELLPLALTGEAVATAPAGRTACLAAFCISGEIGVDADMVLV